MEAIDPAWLKLLTTSPVIGLCLIVWWQLRDQTKLLRSMDLRLAKVLENARQTPAQGIPTRAGYSPYAHARVRARSRADSDEPGIAIARTSTEDDLGNG